MIDLNSKLGRKAKRRLAHEYFVWLTTVGSDLTPHTRPVWFIWEGDSFLIFSKPDAHKVHHIRMHPRVALHFNADQTADKDILIFTGTASLDPGSPPVPEIRADLRKYRTGIADLGMTPEQMGEEYSLAIRVTPTSMRGD